MGFQLADREESILSECANRDSTYPRKADKDLEVISALRRDRVGPKCG